MKKRTWNKKELTIAYYIAKWNFNGLNIDEESLVSGVIKDTTTNSLWMQVSNFRYLLDIPGRQLEHASQSMKDLVKEFENRTYTQMKKVVLGIIDEAHPEELKYRARSHNEKIVKNTEKLNEQLDQTFRDKMKSLMQFRRLRKI